MPLYSLNSLTLAKFLHNIISKSLSPHLALLPHSNPPTLRYSLEDYLEDLSSIKITLDGGGSSLNFAEAALLIQGTSGESERRPILDSNAIPTPN